MSQQFNLSFALEFEDLYQQAGLEKLDGIFCSFLQQESPKLFDILQTKRQTQDTECDSVFLIELAQLTERFLGKLFSLELHIQHDQQLHQQLSALALCKRQFIQKRILRKATTLYEASPSLSEIIDYLTQHIPQFFDEYYFATTVNNWLIDEQNNQTHLNYAGYFVAHILCNPDIEPRYKESILFNNPQKLDFQNLVDINHPIKTKFRNGFEHTDRPITLKESLDQANYCIWCHNQGKDSCRKGLKDKKTENFIQNELRVTLQGCPLDEKISEMNFLKAHGHNLAAFVIITLDNPMVAATGHRICNDCMKACIYQKQEPVNIPKIESQILDSVLDLPWGFEIYSLLTKWNPLNITTPYPKPLTNKRVLIAGQGPAGFTLAHYLMNLGHDVVAIDGLKIEPLAQSLTDPTIPIKYIKTLYEPLNERVVGGFGGVAEYGITVRWNKNYLKIIRLLLERRQQYQLVSGVRLGSTLTIQQAFDLGFDHIALALGAGKPNMLNLPNALARGVKQASDFLMNLQLSGITHALSLANLQIRLPVIVIGGGLTAIDTATEALAYYPLQVLRFLGRYETLCQEHGAAYVTQSWSEEDHEIAREFLMHARAFKQELAQAQHEQREPQFIKLLQAWGGVTLCYRKPFQDAPSYRLNHEEIHFALQEGIMIKDNLNPTAIDIDQYGHVQSLRFGDTILPAKTVFVAAGTTPYTQLMQDEPKWFQKNETTGYFYAMTAEEDKLAPTLGLTKSHQEYPFCYINKQQHISFLGDLHPSYAGNVVKAMASAKNFAPLIDSAINSTYNTNNTNKQSMLQTHEWRAYVKEVRYLTPTIIEVIVMAPQCARNFRPGQFFRLQNFAAFHPHHEVMEGLAITGAQANVNTGLISLIILEMGGSSSLCKYLKPNEPIILMGPTGTPTEIPHNETVLLIGGGLGNAVLCSIGKALKDNNNRVIYFAGYKKLQDRFKKEWIEAAADHVVWCAEEAPGFVTELRDSDYSFHGNLLEALLHFGKHGFSDDSLSLQTIDRMIMIGSDRMMAVIEHARKTTLKPYLSNHHIAIASINAPMQCMMKEICAQCLQKHIDPKTKQEFYVFACTNQDQMADFVDFEHLHQRLKQNSLSEKLSCLWQDKPMKNKNFCV